MPTLAEAAGAAPAHSLSQIGRQPSDGASLSPRLDEVEPAVPVHQSPRRARALSSGAAVASTPRAVAAHEAVQDYWFVRAARVRAFDEPTLPHFQEMQRRFPGMLKRERVAFADVLTNRRLVEGGYVAVSHRWMESGLSHIYTHTVPALSQHTHHLPRALTPHSSLFM